MRTLNTSTVILLILALAVSVGAQELKKDGKYWIGEIEKSFKVAKGGELVMEDINGDITIDTWDKKEVLVIEIKKMDIYTKSEAEAAMDESIAGYRQRGDIVTIGGPGFDRSWIHSYFTVTVPLEFDCDIETEGGDISIRDLTGDVIAGTGGGDLELESINGEVEIKTGGGDIEIENTTQRVTAKTGGGDIEISDSEGSVKVSSGGGDITITQTKDRVSASTGGGDVEISETEGDVEVTTGGGDVDIEDAGGDVDVRTGGGEISIANISGNFRAITGGGEIKAENVKGQLYVKTGGGDVELMEVAGAVDVSTGGGDVIVQVTLKDFSIDHSIDIETGGGDIDLTLPAQIPATIEAEIEYRKRSWEDYEITSDFHLKIETDEVDSRYRVIRASGDINGGGDLVKLQTGGGNININKSR